MSGRTEGGAPRTDLAGGSPQAPLPVIIILVALRLGRRLPPPAALLRLSQRSNVLGVAQHVGHAAERAAFDADLLHEVVDHRRLNAVAQRGVDHLVGDVLARRAAAAAETVDMQDLDALDLLHRLDALADDAF